MFLDEYKTRFMRFNYDSKASIVINGLYLLYEPYYKKAGVNSNVYYLFYILSKKKFISH